MDEDDDDDDSSMSGDSTGSEASPAGRRFVELYLSGSDSEDDSFIDADPPTESSDEEMDGDSEDEPPLIPSGADLDALRQAHNLPDINTLAAGATDIPGLTGTAYQGFSPALRREGNLPTLDELYGEDRPIKSSNPNPLASRHAEEDILNAVHKDIEDAGLTDADLQDRVVNIHISNETGICRFCFSGLGNSKGGDGVIKQFSLLHPTVIVRITAEGADVIRGRSEIRVQGGVLIG